MTLCLKALEIMAVRSVNCVHIYIYIHTYLFISLHLYMVMQDYIVNNNSSVHADGPPAEAGLQRHDGELQALLPMEDPHGYGGSSASWVAGLVAWGWGLGTGGQS